MLSRSPESMMIKKAKHFAGGAHEGQVRNFQDVPYILHPVSVAKLVEVYSESDSTNLLRVVALLHDTVEDTEVSLSEISSEFNRKVAAIVEELTNDEDKIDKAGKTAYLQETLVEMSDNALYVKLCDRLDNVLDLKLTPTYFRKRYAQATKKVIKHLISKRDLTNPQKQVASKIEETLVDLQY